MLIYKDQAIHLQEALLANSNRRSLASHVKLKFTAVFVSMIFLIVLKQLHLYSFYFYVFIGVLQGECENYGGKDYLQVFVERFGVLL